MSLKVLIESASLYANRKGLLQRLKLKIHLKLMVSGCACKELESHYSAGTTG